VGECVCVRKLWVVESLVLHKPGGGGGGGGSCRRGGESLKVGLVVGVVVDLVQLALQLSVDEDVCVWCIVV